MNHLLEYGIFEGSIIPNVNFLFQHYQFWIWVLGTGVNFRFHDTWSILNIIIRSKNLRSTHYLSSRDKAKVLPCLLSISLNFESSSTKKNLVPLTQRFPRVSLVVWIFFHESHDQLLLVSSATNYPLGRGKFTWTSFPTRRWRYKQQQNILKST